TTGAKKKLGKKKRRQAVSPLRRRGGLRALHRRQAPLKRGLDSPNSIARINAQNYLKPPKNHLLSVCFVQISKNDKFFPNLLYIERFCDKIYV
ncbi:MAG: hypothetical protein IIX09_07640, partial [Clostridia bacterium]|nr:hypothetical protein [Clostridia bacterium]